MTAARVLCPLYILASLLPAHATVTSAHHNAHGYVLGFAAVDLLLLLAAAREYLTADEHRATLHRAQRIADQAADYDPIDGAARIALAAACCEAWWTSAGTEHDHTCGRERRAA